MTVKKFDKNTDLKLKLILALALIILAVSARLLPHPANFAPIAGIALFAGAILPLRWALTLPLAAMIASDLVIGLHSLVFLTWGIFVLIVILGKHFIKKIKPTSVIATSIGASILFYLVTNFAVWAEGRMYPMSWAGLVECYYMALPFFRNTLLGDLFYSGMLFSAYVMAYKFAKTRLSFVNT
jgi:hypothetical protein